MVLSLDVPLIPCALTLRTTFEVTFVLCILGIGQFEQEESPTFLI